MFFLFQIIGKCIIYIHTYIHTYIIYYNSNYMYMYYFSLGREKEREIEAEIKLKFSKRSNSKIFQTSHFAVSNSRFIKSKRLKL